LAVFFKVLILESTSNFLNLPKLRGKVTLALSYIVYRRLIKLQTKYLIFVLNPWQIIGEMVDAIVAVSTISAHTVFLDWIIKFLFGG
jgi:hypothetical protein